MSVATETSIQRTNGTFATNAVANTPNTDTLLAAPGAGARLRIYGLYLTWFISVANVPPANASAIVFRAGSLAMSMGLEWPAFPACHWVMPQGVPLAANTALTTVESASAATLNYAFAVHYVVELT